MSQPAVDAASPMQESVFALIRTLKATCHDYRQQNASCSIAPLIERLLSGFPSTIGDAESCSASLLETLMDSDSSGDANTQEDVDDDTHDATQPATTATQPTIPTVPVAFLPIGEDRADREGPHPPWDPDLSPAHTLGGIYGPRGAFSINLDLDVPPNPNPTGFKPLERQNAFNGRSNPEVFWLGDWDNDIHPGDPNITPTQELSFKKLKRKFQRELTKFDRPCAIVDSLQAEFELKAHRYLHYARMSTLRKYHDIMKSTRVPGYAPRAMHNNSNVGGGRPSTAGPAPINTAQSPALPSPTTPVPARGFLPTPVTTPEPVPAPSLPTTSTPANIHSTPSSQPRPALERHSAFIDVSRPGELYPEPRTLDERLSTTDYPCNTSGDMFGSFPSFCTLRANGGDTLRDSFGEVVSMSSGNGRATIGPFTIALNNDQAGKRPRSQYEDEEPSDEELRDQQEVIGLVSSDASRNAPNERQGSPSRKFKVDESGRWLPRDSSVSPPHSPGSPTTSSFNRHTHSTGHTGQSSNRQRSGTSHRNARRANPSRPHGAFGANHSHSPHMGQGWTPVPPSQHPLHSGNGTYKRTFDPAQGSETHSYSESSFDQHTNTYNTYSTRYVYGGSVPGSGAGSSSAGYNSRTYSTGGSSGAGSNTHTGPNPSGRFYTKTDQHGNTYSTQDAHTSPPNIDISQPGLRNVSIYGGTFSCVAGSMSEHTNTYYENGAPTGDMGGDFGHGWNNGPAGTSSNFPRGSHHLLRENFTQHAASGRMTYKASLPGGLEGSFGAQGRKIKENAAAGVPGFQVTQEDNAEIGYTPSGWRY
ncbi:hypothetical protein FA15DRAFT_498317 [Coprinopsis marcescibilis]|uniref:Uncharacterized protein n=1 Tax=Coprinopsis marcescibilis TaxID=230819 RepID=A0A5C3KQL3_COPMA|nr:hypothetical protein FA15DRAFT_498317 [Coprinopsis marcescibilis]